MMPHSQVKVIHWIQAASELLHAPPSFIKWRLHQFVRRYKRIVCRKYYQDNNNEIQRSNIVAGTARSGTTWLGELIASQMPSRIMFEPFHSEFVEEFAQFHYIQYMRPSEDNDALFDIVQRVLKGQIRHPWIDRQVETFRPQQRVIKEIRACLFLRWMHDRFPEVPMIFIIRHPCAVVASRIKLHWTADDDLGPLLAQQPLIEDFLGKKLDVIRDARTDEEKHAIIWCVSNVIPLQQFLDAPLHVVFYENLCLQPEKEIPKIFKAIGQPYNDSVFRYARRPSMASKLHSGIFGDTIPITTWRRNLSEDAIKRVLRIVQEFGLDHLYGDSVIPLQKTTNPQEMTIGY